MDQTSDPGLEMPVHRGSAARQRQLLQESLKGSGPVAADIIQELNPDAVDWSVGAPEPSPVQIAYWESIRSVVSAISDKVYLSGFPDERVQDQMRDLGIDVVYSCTNREPPALDVPVVRVPFDDSVEALPDRLLIVRNAELIANRVNKGERVLIHCLYGLNRSALLAANVLAILYPGIPGEDILELIRKFRPGALHNALFAESVKSLNQPSL